MSKKKEMTPEERELFEERAAILEYYNGMSRIAAEAMAREMLEKQMSLFDDLDR